MLAARFLTVALGLAVLLVGPELTAFRGANPAQAEPARASPTLTRQVYFPMLGRPSPQVSGPQTGPALTTLPAVGAYVDGGPWDPAAWPAFIDLVGRAPAVLMWYQGWGAEEPEFKPEFLDRAYALGAVPMITWEPWDYRRGTPQPQYALRQILAGRFDDYVRRWARASRAYGRPYFLRFAHEMNTSAYPWGYGVSGNRPEQYVEVWRRLRRIFAEEGALNVLWVWSPNVDYPGAGPLEAFFPGDEYVDWVGMDGYNGGAALPWGGWLSFSQVFGPTYRRLTALSTRPIMVAETASAEAGGDKAAWIRSALLKEIPEDFPRIRAVIWFHARKEADWRVNSSPEALSAFREALALSPYLALSP